MTVSTAPTPLSYAGNGSTTAFPITWKYNAKSHVVATLRSSTGTETVWALTTNYTLTDPGDTGTLTAVVAPATGETLVITLEPPNTQSSDLPLGGDFPSTTVEDGLDLSAQRDAKIQSLFDRSLRVPKTDTITGSSLEIPIDTTRAGKYLAFDLSGIPIASAGPTGDSSIPVSTFMETVLDDTTAAAARTTLGAAEDAAVVHLASAETISGNKTFTPPQYFTAGLGPGYIQNYSLSAAVASNALTMTMTGYDGTALSSTNKAQFTFRNATAGTGTAAVSSVTADLTLTISSGSTIGATSGTAFRLWWAIVNDGGTYRLAVRNCSTATTIYGIGDDVLISSTAEGGAGGADSAGVWYTGTAVTSKAARIIGYTEHSLTTAGTWDEVPDKIQLWQPGMKLPGDVVQLLVTNYATFTTPGASIPYDDTIPQNSEGTEFATVAITPVSSCNPLIIEAKAGGDPGTAGSAYTVAIFQDSTANALAANGFINSNGYYTLVTVEHQMIGNTTSSTTFKARFGSNTGNASINGVGARIWGGVLNSYIKVTELVG